MIELPVIDIKCGDADCDNDRHAYNERDYKRLGNGRNFLTIDVCKNCGANDVDFARTRARNEQDIDYVVSMLPRENIRYIFWNRPFNERSLSKAEAMGREKIYGSIQEELSRTVGREAKAGWMYKLVPTDAEKMSSVIQYAQHATAVCCRRCIHEWHGIANEGSLASSEIAYLSKLVRRYLDVRLPATIPR